jgi:GntR family transcriptional regulator
MKNAAETPPGGPSLEERLVDWIRSSSLDAGDRLPSETQFAHTLGVGRSTIREALKTLEHDGLVYAVQGSGRFLSSTGTLSVERPVTKYESITEMLTSLGHVVTTMVLDASEGSATAAEAQALDLKPGSDVIRLTRLQLGDGEPLVLSLGTIPRTRLPGPIAHRDWSQSLTAALERHGHRIVSSSARLTAVDLPAELERRTALAGRGPWLLVEEICITDEGDKVLFAHDYHRGDAIGFNVLRRR